MPLLRRTLLTLSTTLALLLAALWFRSNRVSDILVKDAPPARHYELVTLAGQLRITRVTNWPATQPLQHFRATPPIGYPIFGQSLMPRRLTRLGCAYERGQRNIPTLPLNPNARFSATRLQYDLCSIPLALPIALLALYPAWSVLVTRTLRLRRQHRLATHLCLTCGYDLQATPDRCPECGTPTDPSTNVTTIAPHPIPNRMPPLKR